MNTKVENKNEKSKKAAVVSETQGAVQTDAKADVSNDVILTDDDGKRIAAMREYVFLNLASSGN